MYRLRINKKWKGKADLLDRAIAMARSLIRSRPAHDVVVIWKNDVEVVAIITDDANSIATHEVSFAARRAV